MTISLTFAFPFVFMIILYFIPGMIRLFETYRSNLNFISGISIQRIIITHILLLFLLRIIEVDQDPLSVVIVMAEVTTMITTVIHTVTTEEEVMIEEEEIMILMEEMTEIVIPDIITVMTTMVDTTTVTTADMVTVIITTVAVPEEALTTIEETDLVKRVIMVQF